MLARVVRWSLDRPRLALAVSAVFVAAALLVVRQAPLDLLPDLAPAQAVIQTNAPGLAAEQVEQLVTRPIESAIAGAPGVAHVHSDSVQGLSVVTATLAQGSDPARVREALAERIAALPALPGGAGSPRIAPMTAGGEVRLIGFTSGKLDAMGLRDVVAWTVRPRLLAAPGVAQVSVYGGEVRRIEVRARPGDLSDSDLGFLDILNATRRATSAAGAGFIDTPTQRVQIEPHGQGLTAADIGAGQIQTPGNAPVRIEDVADVAEAPAPAFGDALIDGRPGVLVAIGRQYGANTLAVSRAIDRAMAVLAPALAAQGVEARDDLDRPAGFITGGLQGLLVDLAVSIALIAVALALMLRCWQAVLATLVSIPLALLAAAAGVTLIGWGINAMTLGGLAVALGVVIDDAVLDVENVLRRLRAEGYGHAHEHADCAPGDHASRAQAVLSASLGVRAPLVFATLALALILSPLLLLKGPAGALLAPLAGAIILASAASFLTAVAVTPGLCWLLLRHVHGSADSRAMQGLREAHGRALTALRRIPLLALALAGGAILATVLVMLQLRLQLLPTFHDGRLSVAVEAPASTSVEAMRDWGQRITRELKAVPGVASVAARTGRDPTGDDSGPINRSRFDVQLKPGLPAARQDQVASELERRLKLYPGLHPVVATGVDAGRLGGQGRDAGVVVNVFGPDRDRMEAGARQAAAALSKLPGAGEVRQVDAGGAPTVRIDLDFQRLALYGLSAGDVMDTVQAAFQGETVAQVYANGRVVDVAVSAQTSLRRDPEAIGRLLLRSSSGFSVPLSRVAEVYLTDGPARIGHDHGLPREAVAASPKAPGFAREARAALAELKPPPGVYFEVEDAGRVGGLGPRLAAAYVLALCAVAVLLAVAFDPRTGVLMLASAALALVGGVAAALLTGGVLSIGVVAGLIALFGLSLRHAILLADRLDAMVLTERAPWSWATIEAAARERLAPILTTTVLIALALVPFALHAGAPGREVLGPMSIVILGGLVTSLLGSLLVLPVLVHQFWRPGFGRRMRRADTPAPTGGAGG